MAITLAKLCENTEKKYRMHLVAGKSGMENTVRWVHMVEDREVPDFLHGDELVFTTGIGHIGNESALENFVKSLKEHGAVGVVVNIGPYIKTIPTDLIRYCEQTGFPIFSLPWDVHIIDITYDFCRRIIENEEHETTLSQALRETATGLVGPEKHAALFENNGFLPTNRLRVLVFSFFKEGQNVTESLDRNSHGKLRQMLVKPPYAASIYIENGRLILLRQNCSDQQIERLGAFLQKQLARSSLEYRMGCSTQSNGIAAIPELYRQASGAYTVSLIRGDAFTFYEAIGVYQVIFGVKKKGVLEEFAKSCLGVLREYDLNNKTDLLETLKIYLSSNCSVKQTCEICGVHRNTVNYKIKQVKTILGIPLDDTDKAKLVLALQIQDALKYI